VIRGGEVEWRPALAVNALVLGGQLVVVGLLVARSTLRRRR
jgi:hypothetical protein